MRASGAILLGILAVAARAGDPPPADDSIAAAKRDLAAIKAPAGSQDPSAALPALQMKDIGPMPGASGPQLPNLSDQEKEDALDPSKKKRSTGNWLVDAMDKKADEQKDPKSRYRDKEELLRADQDLLKGDEKDAQMGDATREKSDSKEVANSVYNPLDSFMNGWISAKDHDLLLPSSRGEGLTGSEGAKGRAELLPGLDLGASSAAVESLISPADVEGLADSAKAGPNPYLALLEFQAAPQVRFFSAPDGLGAGITGPPDISRGLSTSGVDRPPAEASRSFIPDFAQPPDDDKYFKQMKKF
jgi:hypothetical protein